MRLSQRFNNLSTGAKYTCDRCNGSGYISIYNHICNGVCFKCSGAGVIISHQLFGASSYQMKFQRNNTDKEHDKVQSITSRWYLVTEKFSDKTRVVFAFTSRCEIHAKKLAQRFMLEKEGASESSLQKFRVIAGDIGEKKKQVIKRLCV